MYIFLYLLVTFYAFHIITINTPNKKIRWRSIGEGRGEGIVPLDVQNKYKLT